MMNDQELLNTFLAEQEYMVIAVTLDDGTPWATPIRIKQHNKNIFEWDSHMQADHSKAIEQRPAIAISLYTPQTDITPLFGVYLKANAELMEETNGIGHYRAIVSEAWINDATFIKRRIELIQT